MGENPISREVWDDIHYIFSKTTSCSQENVDSLLISYFNNKYDEYLDFNSLQIEDIEGRASGTLISYKQKHIGIYESLSVFLDTFFTVEKMRLYNLNEIINH